MSSLTKSRWANGSCGGGEDAREREAKRRREKEEKKRAKAERKRREEAEAEAESKKNTQELDDETTAAQSGDGLRLLRPTCRRRRISPPPPTEAMKRAALTGEVDANALSERPLPLWETDTWKPARSVDAAYAKLNEIEEGAYGWVARGRERATGAVVALKKIKWDRAESSRTGSGFPITALREIQILRACEHDHIMKLLEVVVRADDDETDDEESDHDEGDADADVDADADADEEDDHPTIQSVFLVMEFVEHDLKSLLEDMPQPFLLSETKQLLLQLASGLAYLHSHYILHRDLKTSNLLLNNRGQLKIADFGLARYSRDSSPTPPLSSTTSSSSSPPIYSDLTQVVVTLWYRAPEILLGTPVYGSSVDMWSFGCVMAEMLQRKPLFRSVNEADQIIQTFKLTGPPSEKSWPGFRRLPYASKLQIPSDTVNPSSASSSLSLSFTQQSLQTKFPHLPTQGIRLLSSLLALDPARRPTADSLSDHKFFVGEDPPPKAAAMLPTFPSKASREQRRRQRLMAAREAGSLDHNSAEEANLEEPKAPVKRGHDGDAGGFGMIDLGGIFRR